MTYLKNKIKIITKLLLQKYYCGMYRCNDNTCDVETRQLALDEQCVNPVCRGHMVPDTSEKDVSNTFSYVYSLFDLNNKYKKPEKYKDS